MLAMILFVFFLTYMPGFIVKLVNIQLLCFVFLHFALCNLYFVSPTCQASQSIVVWYDRNNCWVLGYSLEVFLKYISSNQIFDKCYMHPTMHAIAYVFNWASVWINPIIYIRGQTKYQVKNLSGSFGITIVITTVIVKVVIGIAIIMIAQDAVRHLFEGVMSMCGMRQSPRRHLRSFNVSFTALFFCIQLSAWR